METEITDPTELMELDRLTSDELSPFIQREYSSQDVQSFLGLPTARSVDHYLGKVREYAEKCHANGFTLRIGGEALAFELFKDGQPLYAIIRLQTGEQERTKPDIVEIFEEGELELMADEHSQSFAHHSLSLPTYEEEIYTASRDIDPESKGVHLALSPKLMTLTELLDAGVINEDQKQTLREDVETSLSDSGINLYEIDPNNIGVYVDSSGDTPIMYFDTGNIIDSYPHFYAKHSDPNLLALRQEIKADAQKLFAGEQTDYAKRMEDNPLGLPDQPMNWVARGASRGETSNGGPLR